MELGRGQGARTERGVLPQPQEHWENGLGALRGHSSLQKPLQECQALLWGRSCHLPRETFLVPAGSECVKASRPHSPCVSTGKEEQGTTCN